MRPTLKDSEILIVGGAGFIGSHLAFRLMDEGPRKLVICDNLFLGDEDYIASVVEQGAIFYRDDAEIGGVLDYIFRAHNINVVFNCATKPLNYSFVNPHNAYATNPTVTLTLLEALRRGVFQTLCHFSSSEVFGSAQYTPIDEVHPFSPATPYAAGKAAADFLVSTWARLFHLDAFVVRPFNNYGPHQNFRGPLAALIPITIFRLLSNVPPEIYGTGQQSREFIFVGDTVDAVVKLFNKLMPGDSVNISSDQSLTVNEVVGRVCKHLGYQGNILRTSARPGDLTCQVASTAKLNSMITPQATPFENGLDRTIEWIRSRLKM